MKTNRKPQAQSASQFENLISQFENLISRLEQIRRDFYDQIPDSDDTDDTVFENAINEAQTVIGSCMAQRLVDQIRQRNGGGR